MSLIDLSLYENENSKFFAYLSDDGGYINFSNSGKGGEKKYFTLGLASLNSCLKDILNNLDQFKDHQDYIEKDWRDLGSTYFQDKPANAQVTVQTKPLFSTLSKLILWANDLDIQAFDPENKILLDLESIQKTINRINSVIKKFTPNKQIIYNFNNIVDLFKNYNKKYITSIITKPFVIITGNSGTGKTRIALRLAELFNNNPDLKTYALVPVGADWTDNRNVIGFYDAINDVYRSTPILDLLLDAKVNTNKPFFLILDEMNLSHVERYFADFLSAMESGKEIPLHSRVETVLSDSQKEIPKSINLPDNVFITGTVNIDETTYMFSPKVLDRANVIEFKVDKTDIHTFLEEIVFEELEEVAAEGVAESFLKISLKFREPSIRKKIIEDNSVLFNRGLVEIKSTLKKLFEILEGSNMEFAYRTMEEILRYMKVSFELTEDKEEWNWKENMDVQVLQKILPKLHGSKRKMEPILTGMKGICNELDFKNSNIKLDRMIKTLSTDQFVSFI